MFVSLSYIYPGEILLSFWVTYFHFNVVVLAVDALDELSDALVGGQLGLGLQRGDDLDGGRDRSHGLRGLRGGLPRVARRVALAVGFGNRHGGFPRLAARALAQEAGVNPHSPPPAGRLRVSLVAGQGAALPLSGLAGLREPSRLLARVAAPGRVEDRLGARGPWAPGAPVRPGLPPGRRWRHQDHGSGRARPGGDDRRLLLGPVPEERGAPQVEVLGAEGPGLPGSDRLARARGPRCASGRRLREGRSEGRTAFGPRGA